MKLFRASLRVFVLLVVLGIAAGVYVAYAPYGDTAAHPFNQDRNAVWLEHRWLEKPHSVEEMEQMFRFLDHHGIVYAYPHLIPFDSAGRLPLHNREQMRAFLASARRVAPNMKLLPWVGGLRVGYKRSRAGTIDLGDLGQRQRMVAECRGLMDEGFDGIHVNVEPIANGDDDYLALLRALRAAVGTGILSLSATRPGPMAPAFAPNFFWTADYYARIADSADQVVLMTYDTAIPTPSLYRRYVAYAARTVTANLARSHRTRVLVGIPTYDETGLMHRKGVETPENALLGVVSGLRGRTGGTFEGVALYAEWTTDPEDWATYERV
ncbi:MAG TPA: glycoside hydrolase family 18 protein, partial [Vicinamibacteria bacterium]|nr:glycoside hydrolase family 18 protein [Vicinamibacteria bacterium]